MIVVALGIIALYSQQGDGLFYIQPERFQAV